MTPTGRRPASNARRKNATNVCGKDNLATRLGNFFLAFTESTLNLGCRNAHVNCPHLHRCPQATTKRLSRNVINFLSMSKVSTLQRDLLIPMFAASNTLCGTCNISRLEHSACAQISGLWVHHSPPAQPTWAEDGLMRNSAKTGLSAQFMQLSTVH